MSRSFFVIYNSDGDTHVSIISEETLIERLEEEYWGNVEILRKLPSNSDTNYWGDAILIIEGKIPEIEQVEIVTKYIVR